MVVSELPRFECQSSTIYGDRIFWTGFGGLGVSFSQQKFAFLLARKANSLEILDLKTKTWSGYTLSDPKRPQWGGRSPDSVQFINSGTVILTSVGECVLITIDSNGCENVRNIEDEIRENGPVNPNIRRLEWRKFVGPPSLE